MVAAARRGGWQSFATGGIAGALGLITLGVAAGSPTISLVPALLLLVALLGAVAVRIAASWPRLIIGIALVDLLIPSDGRYIVGGGLPFQLEPYRIVVGVLIIGWLAALLVDPEIRARRSRFEGPIWLILLAILGSELLNPGRVSHVQSNVIKSLWLFLSFVLLMYLTISVVRDRAVLERILTLLVSAGCVVAVGAIVQRRAGYNIFDHLHTILPVFSFNPASELENIVRGGNLRATASAGHPIELSNTLSMLTPIAVYLGVSRHQRRWGLAVAVLMLGDLSSGSRTGVIGFVAILIVFLWLRPRQTLKCWPAVIPLAVAVHVFAPGALGGIINGFFPSGGLIAQQSQTYMTGGQTVDANRLSRVGPVLHSEFAKHNPLFGEGFGTRVTGRVANANAIVLDDQWLGTLLETGILGVVGWAWLFVALIRRLGARAKLERGTPEGWLPVALAASTAAFALSMQTYDAFGFIQGMVLEYLLIALSSILLWLPPVTPGGSPQVPAPGPHDASQRIRRPDLRLRRSGPLYPGEGHAS